MYEFEKTSQIVLQIDCVEMSFHSVQGLREALHQLVNSSIMSGDTIMKLSYKIVAILEKNDERAEISLLDYGFRSRI